VHVPGKKKKRKQGTTLRTVNVSEGFALAMNSVPHSTKAASRLDISGLITIISAWNSKKMTREHVAPHEQPSKQFCSGLADLTDRLQVLSANPLDILCQRVALRPHEYRKIS
jgi:hypothetical protein